MQNYLESILERYVLATLDSPTQYLIFKNDKVSFTQHIHRATKTAGKKTAQTIRDEFYAYTGMTDVELAILPVKISYELVLEDSMIEGD